MYPKIPKITTANRLISASTSKTVTLPPPFGGTTCRPLDGLSMVYVCAYVDSVFAGVLKSLTNVVS